MPVTVEHIENIYHQFRRSQADFNNRGYRMPKDFEVHFNNRFKETNQKALIKITGWFLTKWQSIDPYNYFMCGFEIYGKGFSYIKFFKEKILLLYVTRDKNKKRQVVITKQGLIKSAVFVKKWMSDNNITLDDYIHAREGHQKIAVDHYLTNKIDASFLIYLITKGLILTDTERGSIPYVQKNFRKITLEFGVMQVFLRKLGGKLL